MILVAIVSCCLFVYSTSAINHDEALIDWLFNNQTYKKEIRPVRLHTEPVCVDLDMSVDQMQKIVEKDQVMAIQVRLVMEWNDYHLQWDPRDFGGLTEITVPAEWIWKPDIALYNNADGYFDITILTKPWIESTGKVRWAPPSIYKSSCRIDVTYFPFDQQICEMKLGPWSHSTDQVDVTAKRFANLKNFKPNGEWQVVAIPAQKHIISYEQCCGRMAYADVTYYVLLRRKYLYLTINLIGPCVLISLLTIVVFYVPSQEGEKGPLCISILLALTLFLLLIVDIMPATSVVVPLISKYLIFTLISVTLSIVFTVIVLNIHNRGLDAIHMPTVIHRIFLEVIPRWIKMERPKSTEEDFHLDNLSDRFLQVTNRVFSREDNPLITFDEFRTSSGTIGFQDIQIQKLIEDLVFISKHLKNKDECGTLSDDWKFLAMVIDRLLLYAYILVSIIGTCAIIFNSPAIYDPNSEKLMQANNIKMFTGESVSNNAVCPGVVWINGTGSISRPSYWIGK